MARTIVLLLVAAAVVAGLLVWFNQDAPSDADDVAPPAADRPGPEDEIAVAPPAEPEAESEAAEPGATPPSGSAPIVGGDEPAPELGVRINELRVDSQDAVTVIRQLAVMTGLNIIVSPDAAELARTSEVTLHLSDVDVSAALDLVTEPLGLRWEASDQLIIQILAE